MLRNFEVAFCSNICGRIADEDAFVNETHSVQSKDGYLLIASCYACAVEVRGHGRLLLPPSRSSMFRYKDTDPYLISYRDIIPANFDDNQLNCGGLQNQIDQGGKCGVCGDPYQDLVRANEAGGKYALGIITRNFKAGQFIETTVEITAEHKGYFEFRLCPWNNVHVPVTQECLNQNLLTFDDGETKWYLPADALLAKGVHVIPVKLPDHVTCEQCVLQWRYRAGNGWGSENGISGLGLGQQEEFYGCSDIAISSSDEEHLPTEGSEPVVSTSSSLASTSSTNKPATTATKTIAATTTKTIAATTSSKPVETTSTERPEIVDPIPGVDCEKVGMNEAVFRTCDTFYICAQGYYEPFVFQCAPGTYCDMKDGMCKHEREVPYPCGTRL